MYVEVLNTLKLTRECKEINFQSVACFDVEHLLKYRAVKFTEGFATRRHLASYQPI